MINNYYRPETLADALALKKQHGDEAAWLAGGSRLNRGSFEHAATTLISLEKLGLKGIEVKDGSLEIGAMVTLQQLIESTETSEELKAVFAQIFNRNIRNQSTLGGEIAAANGRCEVMPGLIAAGAHVVLADDSVFSVEEYLQAEDKALILKVVVPANLKALKIRKITNSAAAEPILAAAVARKADDTWGIALSGVAEKPVRLRDAEALVGESQLAEGKIEQLQKVVSDSIKPVSDFRASAEYRSSVSGVVVVRLVDECAPISKSQ
ncbi:FAD binding domain-containing protein [Sansalvadorimonas sp. 2012CJ34-2]|uniref:FAD binding domain-containing protein n=1 Tax=Parendozoicomonas callyspongiae TaxID=2942213 RepID=A0ABT0PGH4_9GAMM|nr:FAD binding domain-containing protein [Sansalvadorimonas sp. 2012CJ34-2]MCL6270485.1 FAD binding domain-containing protein [Sansalvadorimonas sp. 2012CJ34-2]